MENFNFFSPTRIIFGRDSEECVGRETKKYGKKVLLHYGGGSIKRSGLYDKVVGSLKSENIDFLTGSVLKEGSGRVLGRFWDGLGRISKRFLKDFGGMLKRFLKLFARIWNDKQ